MAAMPFIFPIHLFNPTPAKVDVVAKVISGGTAINDDETVIQTDGGGRWEGTYGGIALRTVYQRRVWDAWSSHLSGGNQAFLMPVLNSLEIGPRPVSGNRPARPSRLIVDDDYFPTTVKFAHPYVVAETVGAVPLRSTTLTVIVTRGSRITPGMRFSIGERPHKVGPMLSSSGQQATFVISPPTREAVADGTPVNFDWPLLRAKGVIGQDLAPSIETGRSGTVSIAFVEDFSTEETP